MVDRMFVPPTNWTENFGCPHCGYLKIAPTITKEIAQDDENLPSNADPDDLNNWLVETGHADDVTPDDFRTHLITQHGYSDTEAEEFFAPGHGPQRTRDLLEP